MVFLATSPLLGIQVVHHLGKLDMFRALLMLNEVDAVLCVRRARPISFPRFWEFKWSINRGDWICFELCSC